MKFSIVIPACNEAARIGAGLDAIRAAAAPYPGQVEVIVVLNRCTDATAEIAQRHGAVLVREDGRNLSRIRNAGARVATGDILVTIDADSRMSPNMLAEIDRALGSGRHIGGGVPIRSERHSLGIFITGVLLVCMLPGLSAGLFWCRRADFLALGGFDEAWRVGEDVDFARRLRAAGRARGLRFGTLWRAHIVTSCRKFDTFGDWHFVRHPGLLWRGVRGVDDGLGDRYFYDYHV